MGKKRAGVWEGYEFSEDGKIAICKECRSQLVATGSAGTSHVRRHKRICVGRQDGPAPPPPDPDASNNWEKGTAVLARQDGDGAPPPIASPTATPAAAPPLGLGASSESWNYGEAALAFLALQDEDGAPPPIGTAPTIGPSPESSNCSKAANWEEATGDLARMIALRGYDPSFVEDSYFRSFVRRLNPDFQLPSRAAIEHICDGVCDGAKGVLTSELERTSGKVSLAVDTAETALGKVVYAACHFIDEDWRRRVMICDVKTVVPQGMRPIPLSVGRHAFDSFEFQMNAMAVERIRSSDRVISKALQKIGDLSECLKFGRYDALQMVATSFFNNIHENFVQGLCWASTGFEYKATRQERGDFYSQHGLDYLVPNDEPWISFYFWLQLHKRERGSNRSSPTHKSQELVRGVLREIYRASKNISDPHRPTSNIVLREWFKVRETLQSSLADASGDEADLHKEYFHQNAVDIFEEAERILDGSIKNEYLQWSIPLVLDPRYKLQHMQVLFIRAFGSQARYYISNIRKKIKELFTSFSIDGGETTDDADQIHEAGNTSAHQLELDLYLEDPRMEDTDDFDILNWWKLNTSTYPTLARMARYVLAIPTSSKLSSEQMAQITSKIRGYTKGILQY